MNAPDTWTGRTACALQAALRMTNHAFAEKLGLGLRTVAGWHDDPELSPRPSTQQILDIELERASDAEKRRFAQFAGLGVAGDSDSTDAERRLSEDQNVGAALEWLDKSAGWTPGTGRTKVAARLADIDLRHIQDRAHRRGQINQRQVAESLATYYGPLDGYGTYRATVDGKALRTSVLAKPEWLDLECDLTPESDTLTLTSNPTRPPEELDEFAASHAVNRLAEALAAGIRIIDAPLYRLLDVDIRRGMCGGVVGLSTFVHYALTLDLLESELVDALASDAAIMPGGLPLRDRYLPDTASVINVDTRLCAGGALALCAIARPAGPHRRADFLLLVQERSGRVLNAARRLAVTPKGFHQPMADYRHDTRIAFTLMREMEEELFGRDEVDNTTTHQLTADPLHPKRVTRPMRWLTKVAGRLKIETTGFGLNLVSGNYESANLIVIDDEKFWDRFGGDIEANWETDSLRRYSSLDRELLTELVSDPAWSNEGLFALLQGLRRLAQLAPDRVDLPAIDWTLA